MERPDPRIWDGVLAHLRRHHPARCRQWFESIELIGIDNGVLRLRVPQAIHLKYLQRECTSIFQDAAQDTTGRLVAVRFEGLPSHTNRHDHPSTPKNGSANGHDDTNNQRPNGRHDDSTHSESNRQTQTEFGAPAQTGTPVEPPADAPADSTIEITGAVEQTSPEMSLPAREDEHLIARGPNQSTPNTRRGDPSIGTFFEDMVINPDYTFDNFVVGPDNQLAQAGAIAVAEQPGCAYNPFFVHGGVGLGKTHLLQAICQTAMMAKPDIRIYYVSCEGFKTQFMDAVQAGRMAEFRNRYRNIDILVVDDIHFLARLDRTQEEFFHTFNSLYQARKQIVLSSDAAPQEIPDLEVRLVSRFKSGLVARIDRPCYETRIAIIKRKAELRGLKLEEDVACYLAHTADQSIRELEGALTQLQALAMTTNRPIDLTLAKDAIGETLSTPSGVVGIQDIISRVSQNFGVKPADLLSKRRPQSITTPRQVAMYLARKLTNHSLQEIGGFFGGRDHTTVMHAVARTKEKREGDPSLDHMITSLERELGE